MEQRLQATWLSLEIRAWGVIQFVLGCRKRAPKCWRCYIQSTQATATLFPSSSRPHGWDSNRNPPSPATPPSPNPVSTLNPAFPNLITSTEFSLEKTYFSHFLSLLPQSSQDDRCCLPTWHPFTFLLVKASEFPLMSYPPWSTRFTKHWPHTTHHHRDEWKIKTWPSRVMGIGPGMKMERGSALWILLELLERMCCGC